MKYTLAHIVNPFIASKDSDLHYAQPITFRSMEVARKKAEDVIDVEILAACYREDESIVPKNVLKTSFLTQSVLDFENFNRKIRLPLIGEILSKAINESSAEYILYTNIDIGLYPDFYLRVNALLQQGYDALIINRKRIEPLYREAEDLEKIWKQPGKPHPGFDCFLFHRSLFNKMELAHVCIGVPFIEISFSQNLFHLSNKFKLVETDDYTFHIGMEIFKNRAPKEYFEYNRKEFYKVEKALEGHMKKKNLPYSNLWFPFRIIQWGLHPCIPIRLAMKLEWRSLFR